MYFPYILCDINLDYEKEGMDIIRIHGKMNRKGRIIAFSSEIYSIEELESIGFDCFLTKNADSLEMFLEKISKSEK